MTGRPQYAVVGIKSLLDAIGITPAHVLVNTAQLELVLLTSMTGRPRYAVVGIKSLLDAIGITPAHVLVNTAQLELVMLVYFNEKYAK
uniref:Uncharacterized protein n=1 Tax=Tanacetum cinerariifolium TaxID=118510 RepID=A0A699JJY5_TANCI|nr:hypothetical protein [Tanacetum cinerariifolium]